MAVVVLVMVAMLVVAVVVSRRRDAAAGPTMGPLTAEFFADPARYQVGRRDRSRRWPGL